MSRVRANTGDQRRQTSSQAIFRTFGGIFMEQGPSGSQMLLPTVLNGYAYFQADAGVATEQIVGDLPLGVWINGNPVNHAALTSGTCQIDLPAYGGEGAVNLVAALADLTVADELTLANGVYVPTPISRPVSITITGGTTGESALISIPVNIADKGWS